MTLSLLLCPLLGRLPLSNTNGPVSAAVVSLAVQATSVKHHWSPLLEQKFARAAVI